VLAVVSFGAEVIADGSIHVYAPLRGRAIAGAQGDTQARIFAACMEPQLVSIAGTWRTTEAGLPPEVAGKPAQAPGRGQAAVRAPEVLTLFAKILERTCTDDQDRRGDLRQGRCGQDHHIASFASGLALRGFKTAVIDFDVGLRNLDLIMGCERRVVYDLINVIHNEATSSRR
jgi:hypothetical protein